MFPEALEEAQLEELDAIIKPIEQFFTEAGMSIPVRRGDFDRF